MCQPGPEGGKEELLIEVFVPGAGLSEKVTCSWHVSQEQP